MESLLGVVAVEEEEKEKEKKSGSGMRDKNGQNGQNGQNEQQLRMVSALKGETKDFIVQHHLGVRPMDLGPFGWLSSILSTSTSDSSDSSAAVAAVAAVASSTVDHSFDVRNVDLRTSSLLHKASRTGASFMVAALLETGIAVDIAEEV